MSRRSKTTFGRGGATPSGMIGLTLAIDYIFAEWPFRKLTGRCAGHIFERFAYGGGRMFDVECVIPEHILVNRQFEAEYRVAVWRDTFQQRSPLRLRGRYPVNSPAA